MLSVFNLNLLVLSELSVLEMSDLSVSALNKEAYKPK